MVAKIAEIAKAAEIDIIGENERVRIVESFQSWVKFGKLHGLSKKGRFSIKIYKCGKNAVKCVLNVFFSKMTSALIMRFFWEKRLRKLWMLDNYKLWLKIKALSKKNDFVFLEAFFTSKGRRK